MKTVFVNKEDLKNTILRGDNCQGAYYFVLSEDGEYKIAWDDDNSAWSPWNDDEDVIMKVPSLIPEGSGDFYHCIRDDYNWGNGIEDKPTKQDVEEMCEEGLYINHADWIEQNDEEWYKEYVDKELDWLAEAFLDALNGGGWELNDPDPWREQEIDGQEPSEVFNFEWEE